jgi:hypothetical protein
MVDNLGISSQDLELEKLAFRLFASMTPGTRRSGVTRSAAAVPGGGVPPGSAAGGLLAFSDGLGRPSGPFGAARRQAAAQRPPLICIRECRTNVYV